MMGTRRPVKGTREGIMALYIQFRRFVQGFGYIFPILFPLSDALGEQVFDLSVEGAKIVLRPGGKLFIQAGGDTEGNLLLFAALRHINTGCRN